MTVGTTSIFTALALTLLGATNTHASVESPIELIFEGDFMVTEGESLRVTAIFGGTFTFNGSSFVQIIVPLTGDFYTFGESYRLDFYDDSGTIIHSVTHVNENPVDPFGRPGYLTNSNTIENLFADGVATFELTMLSGSINVSEVQVNVSGNFVPHPDSDGDGVPDNIDNCTNVANATQLDTNGDGFGNLCDADLSGDCIVNLIDLAILRTVFFTSDPDADFNGDEFVNLSDLSIFRTLYFLPPGPSGLASCP